jgi:exonuclease VII small subunit
MNNKTVTYVLIAVAAASLLFGLYEYKRANDLSTEWQLKYEEALIDVEEATTRLERTKEDLEKALAESEQHRKMAEEALAELNKQKGKK